MKNFEKYETEIKEFDGEFSVSKEDGSLATCFCSGCEDCLFYSDTSTPCSKLKFNWLYREYQERVLSWKEMKYIKNAIIPFKDCYVSFKKIKVNEDYMRIRISVDDEDNFYLPEFKKDDLYKGMELSMTYELEDLGIFMEDEE